MARNREKIVYNDSRGWGMPTIWGILAVILIVGLVACCGLLHHVGIS